MAMIVTAIKTPTILPGLMTIESIIDGAINAIEEHSVLVITSKIVSLCENRVIPIDKVDKEQLIQKESERYVSTIGAYGFRFTITKNTLIPSAGIDESNGNGNYILWPADAQTTANKAREYVHQRFNVKEVGVVITDSTSSPLRRGTSGICLAHSGFKAQNDYRDKLDLFGRPYNVSQSNVAGGLAASAVLAMGEGSESTPLCLIKDIDFVQFQDHNPTKVELEQSYISADEDIFAPLLSSANWKKGGENDYS
jgi:dihydrofolate synthase / folylpolyglutamate synthase